MLENYVAVCQFTVGEKKIIGVCVNIYGMILNVYVTIINKIIPNNTKNTMPLPRLIM